MITAAAATVTPEHTQLFMHTKNKEEKTMKNTEKKENKHISIKEDLGIEPVFYVSEDKRVTACVVKIGDRRFRGISRCSEGDTPDEVIGMELAEARCMAKVLKCLEKKAKQALQRDEEMKEYWSSLVEEVNGRIEVKERNVKYMGKVVQKNKKELAKLEKKLK